MGFERERERKPKDKTREPIQHPNTMAPAMSVANKNFLGKRVVARQTRAARAAVARRNAKLVVKAGAYDEELIATANSIASQGRGILAMDEDNRRAYRQLLVTTPGLGEYISGAILFEETLYQSTKDGKPFVDCLKEANIVPGIKVDKGLVPMANSNKESWCQGLDGLAERCAEYYKQGARFAKWRSVVNITAGPTDKALNDCAYGLARYAAIAQDNGLVPIVEPEILLDGEHDIDTTLEVASRTWAQNFKYLADQDVNFEGILLKPSMVTPGADNPNKCSPETVAEYTLKMLNRRVPPAVPGIMFLSGGQSELESTLNLNAMNQSPNPWHVSFSYARALQNTVLKTWKGDDANVDAAQAALIGRAKANSLAQLGKYDASGEAASAGEGMFEKGYVY